MRIAMLLPLIALVGATTATAATHRPTHHRAARHHVAATETPMIVPLK
jgi:hypothetical protein